MGETYSLGAISLLQVHANNSNSSRYELGNTYIFREQSYKMPVNGTEDILRANSDLIREIANSSKTDATKIFLEGVSGGVLRMQGNDSITRAIGANEQTDWDYKKYEIRKAYGITKNQGEELGNLNYAFVGYEYLMDQFEEMGIDEKTADQISRDILRRGGGAYQVINDINKGRFWAVTRTSYGEEVKDVAIIEAGFDLARFKRMSRQAEKYGVKLDPKAFGFEPSTPSEYKLQDSPNEIIEIAKELQRKIDSDLAQWKAEREARRKTEQEELRDKKRAILEAIERANQDLNENGTDEQNDRLP